MQKRILLIDDEELITRTLEKALQKQGHEVIVAKRSDDAIVIVEEMDFDLVISDIRMPGLNGVDAVKKILKIVQERGNKIPTIFITGYADETIEKRANELKPAAYFFKPFDYVSFINKVEEVLKS